MQLEQGLVGGQANVIAALHAKLNRAAGKGSQDPGYKYRIVAMSSRDTQAVVYVLALVWRHVECKHNSEVGRTHGAWCAGICTGLVQ
jgi:hypothetical protein